MVKILNQGSYFHRTDRTGDIITVRATFLDSCYECSVLLGATVTDCRITAAHYGVLRTPDGFRKEAALPELIGGSAGFDGTAAFKALPDLHDKGHIKELFMECLRAVSQAETWLTKEKGFADRDSYEVFWQSDKLDFCRPYQKKENFPSLKEWPAHIGADKYIRSDYMYNKYKTWTLIQEGDGDTVTASGTFQDCFHEMYMRISWSSATGIIKSFDMETHRAPHKQCFEMSHTRSDLFIGKNINTFKKKKDIGGILGGGPGCFHLTDLAFDILSAANEL